MRLLHPWPVLAATTLIVAACGDELIGPSAVPILADASARDHVNQVFMVTNTNDAGVGSLRQALDDANAAAGKDGVYFAIPGGGPHMIQPASPLPFITDPVVIDGYTQPGARRNRNRSGAGSNAVLKIELNGSNAGIADGLSVSAASSTIKGLVINGFALNGVLISGSGSTGNRVEGNFIGTDVSGTVAIPNGLPEPIPSNSAAVQITDGASHNVIGGGRTTARCDRTCNVISGNNRTGVWINEEANNNTVQGNLIGTDAGGTTALGNPRWGVVISADASHNTIASNRIEWSGRDGVLLASGASQNTIGGVGVTPGTCDGPCNVIAFNGTIPVFARDGVRLAGSTGTGNAILGNSIFSNLRGLGIDHGFAGVTFNDPGDVDGGPNNQQNFPVLTHALAVGGGLLVRGTIDTPNSQTVTIEFFANAVPTPGGDPSGHGEGAVFLGRATPDASGSFSAALPAVGAGTLISATATDAEGSTSEFAANVEPHGRLFGTGASSGNLLEIDRATGVGRVVGSVGFPVPSLAIDPTTGMMYAGSGGGFAALFTVAPASGVATFVGNSGLGFAAIGGMDFTERGVLYAAVNLAGDGGTGSDHLATIDKATGAATVIGPFGSCIDVTIPANGLGSCTIEGVEAIAFDEDGDLWGAKSARGASGTTGLYRINRRTGAATFVSPIVDRFGNPPSGGVVSLQSGCSGDDDILLGGTARGISSGDGGRLVAIDVETGKFSFVGTGPATSFGSSLGGLACFASGDDDGDDDEDDREGNDDDDDDER